MLTFLPSRILGSIVFLLMLINLLFWMFPVYTCILFKLVTWGRARTLMSKWVATTSQTWAHCNVLIWDACLDIEWDLRGIEELDKNGQYLAICNHQNWNDILAQIKAFDGRAPFFKFFMKQILIWVPVLGLAWWGLDFPFMKRHKPEQIAKNPDLRRQDIETTRKACEKYRDMPVLILNFLEGTRFTKEKHQRQDSPYQNLLRPKAGGLAFAMSVMGERINTLMDITIVYPDGPCQFWDFVSGRLKRVILEVREREIPAEFFHGDYAEDAEFRAEVKAWVEQIWWEKDQRITELLAEANSN
ncbi:MAG: acyltransferase [Salinisphaeraceae bacterium]|nr:acyltransferase [Salinisphaeraceae bacterium]